MGELHRCLHPSIMAYASDLEAAHGTLPDSREAG
jgi:hypothetical protein